MNMNWIQCIWRSIDGNVLMTPAFLVCKAKTQLLPDMEAWCLHTLVYCHKKTRRWTYSYRGIKISLYGRGGFCEMSSGKYIVTCQTQQHFVIYSCSANYCFSNFISRKFPTHKALHKNMKTSRESINVNLTWNFIRLLTNDLVMMKRTVLLNSRKTSICYLLA